MAGDNAIAVGVAAAGLSGKQRHRAVYGGIALAACLRILFAIFAVQMLQITGLMAAGGLILLWVAWKMYREIRRAKNAGKDTSGIPPVAQKFSNVLLQIAIADISMSLDNVLAVAGVAHNHPTALVIGLALSVVFVGAAAAYVARLTARYKWIAWVGVVIVIYTALHMIWQGAHEITGIFA